MFKSNLLFQGSIFSLRAFVFRQGFWVCFTARQGLFTSEQKADPTPRFFVCLDRDRMNRSNPLSDDSSVGEDIFFFVGGCVSEFCFWDFEGCDWKGGRKP